MPVQGAVVHFMGTAKGDVERLVTWYNAPITYDLSQVPDESWNNDSKQGLIGTDETTLLFQTASDLLLRYQYYPESVLQVTSDFGFNDRTMVPEDRMLLRVHVLQLANRHLVDALVVNRVVKVIREARRTEIAYVTTSRHSEVGVWRGAVHWRENASVWITVEAYSKTAPYVLWPVTIIVRLLQRRAWQLGMTHFIEQARITAGLPIVDLTCSE